MTNVIHQRLLRLIAASGPISIAQYMHLCHADPGHGYYATGNPVGKTGDFITAPEISQMFGELIGIWSIDVWHRTGKPVPFQIAELGPGRGTLMRDFLRAAQTSQEFFEAITLALVETSPSLRDEQRAALTRYAGKSEWYASTDELPPIATLFIGNEFLDAIPFRQFIKAKGQWHELCVAGDDKGELVFVPGVTGIDENLLPDNHENQPDGTIFEIAPAREAVTTSIANHIKTHGGAALLIDYGHEIPGFGSSFQAVKAHAKTSPLHEPGNCDLTSHVDFEAIARAAKAEGVRVLPLISQGDFLLKLGLLERAGALGRNESSSVQAGIQADVARLVSSDQMGDLFKVMCITNRACQLPPFANPQDMLT